MITVTGIFAGAGGPPTRADNGRHERMWTSPACLGTHRQDALDFESEAS